MMEGSVAERSQLPSQVTRASIGPSEAPPRQPAVGSGRAKATIAAGWAPAEWPKTIIVAGSPPYSAACARANATAQAAWDWYGRVVASDRGQAGVPGRGEDDEAEVRHLAGVLTQVVLAALEAVEHHDHGPRPGLGRGIDVERARPERRVGQLVDDVGRSR